MSDDTDPPTTPPDGPDDPPTGDDTTWIDAPGGSLPSFPGYEVLDLVATSGLAAVYRARNVSSGRLEALKALRVGVTTEHVNGDSVLVHEAMLMARLRHPHIVQAYGVGCDQGRHYLAMELTEGGDLHQRLRDGPLGPREAARLMEAVARAVHYVNSEGVIHRNLKPANILLTRAGEPRLADFELALALADEKVERDIGHICGTPAYMAPEQINGQRLGPATDVYGLGATLYALVTGQPPFTGSSVADLLPRVLSEEPAPPRTINPAVPADLEAIILRCLEKDAAKRYPTAAAVADELRRFQAGQPVEARPLSAVGRALRWLTGGN